MNLYSNFCCVICRKIVKSLSATTDWSFDSEYHTHTAREREKDWEREDVQVCKLKVLSSSKHHVILKTHCTFIFILHMLLCTPVCDVVGGWRRFFCVCSAKNSCLLTTRVSRSNNLACSRETAFSQFANDLKVSLSNEKGQNTFVRESHVFLRRPRPRGSLHVWALSNGKIPANRFPWDEEHRRGWHGECSNTDLVTTFWKATFLHHHNVVDLHKDDVSVDNGPRSSSREKVAMEPCGEVSPRWWLECEEELMKL